MVSRPIRQSVVIEIESGIVERHRRLAVADIGKASGHVIQEAGEIFRGCLGRAFAPRANLAAAATTSP
jgi:hypothetical protein